MLPAAVAAADSTLGVWIWVLAGFSLFFAFEQLLHWHRCHHAHGDGASTLPTLIVIGDALHNFLPGMAVAGTFLVDTRLGIATWLAEAAHELPQEVGEYGVLVHGGWSRRKALVVNVLTSLPFLFGGLLTWAASLQIDVAFLVPFAAGKLPLHRGFGPDSGSEPAPPARDRGAALRGLRGGRARAARDPHRARELADGRRSAPCARAEPFGRAPDGTPVERVTLASPSGLTVVLLSWGATLAQLLVPTSPRRASGRDARLRRSRRLHRRASPSRRDDRSLRQPDRRRAFRAARPRAPSQRERAAASSAWRRSRLRSPRLAHADLRGAGGSGRRLPAHERGRRSGLPGQLEAEARYALGDATS